MNRFVGMGRLTRDPDVHQSGETKVTRYTLAVDRRVQKGQEKTADFISCVAFGKSAEFAEKYFKKGTQILVSGRIQTGSYKNKDGVTIYTTDVVVDDQEFAGSKSDSAPKAEQKAELDTTGIEGFMHIPEGINEELPFV